MRVDLRNFERWWDDLRLLTIAFTFGQPRIGVVLGATFAGILLSAATDLLLRTIGVEPSEARLARVPGLTLLASSILLTWLSFALQAFHDRLVSLGKTNAPWREKALQFLAWEQRRLVFLMTLALLIAVGASVVALYAFRPVPTVSAPASAPASASPAR